MNTAEDPPPCDPRGKDLQTADRRARQHSHEAHHAEPQQAGCGHRRPQLQQGKGTLSAARSTTPVPRLSPEDASESASVDRSARLDRTHTVRVQLPEPAAGPDSQENRAPTRERSTRATRPRSRGGPSGQNAAVGRVPPGRHGRRSGPGSSRRRATGRHRRPPPPVEPVAARASAAPAARRAPRSPVARAVSPPVHWMHRGYQRPVGADDLLAGSIRPHAEKALRLFAVHASPRDAPQVRHYRAPTDGRLNTAGSHAGGRPRAATPQCHTAPRQRSTTYTPSPAVPATS